MVIILPLSLCGVVFYHSLYILLRNVLVPKFLRAVGHAPEHTKPHTYAVEVAEVSERLNNFIQGVMGTIVGIVVISETYHDFVYARSNILQYFISFVVWYYIYDTYVMCVACNLRINSGVGSLTIKCWRVFTKKLPFVCPPLHHAFPLGFVIYTINRGMGHMLVGCLCFTLHTDLFITFTFIMNMLHKTSSIWYTVLGSCAVLSFIFRVLMAPLLYVYYGVQYGLGPVAVVKSMTLACRVANLIFTLGQLFLLTQVLGIVRKYFHRKHHKNT